MSKLPCLCLLKRNAVQLTENYYTAQHTAQMLGLKFTQVLMLIKKKKLTAEVFGKRIMINKQEIIRYADENKIYLR